MPVGNSVLTESNRSSPKFVCAGEHDHKVNEMAVAMVEMEQAETNSAALAEPPNLAIRLRRKILSRRARVGVIGLGYVGLPLSTEFAEAGFEVLGFELDAGRAAAINTGRSYVPDVPTDLVGRLVEDGFLSATTEMARLADVDVISICVPTPLSKTRDPDISAVAAATEAVSRSLRPGQLVILESTTYPGTTREVILPRLEATGLCAGEDFFLVFSPERVDPGNQVFGIKNTPKVVGGVGEQATELAALFYRQVVERVVMVDSPEAAEMVKLLENTFRSVNIALANETALMCDLLGLNVWQVIEAAATKPFGFMPFHPGPGIGGHCIPLDPYYLAWKMKTLNYRARFIELAGEVNAQMPIHVVSKVGDGLNEVERSMKGADIVVLGVAYKANVDDPRESPALDIIELLRRRGARVTYHDPHVPTVDLQGTPLHSEPLTPERLAAADCVVIATNHSAFDYEMIVSHARLIVDTRNALRGIPHRDATVIRL
jgi:UDP-N-acetyl-D-glucosamine dehydrogenase